MIFAGEINGSALDSDAVREQLKRILASPEFTANQRRKDFLSYVVEETLTGRAERLKGYSIAVSVYERDENFDADADPVVRLEARRLRRELEHYYLTSGRRDPIKISIPKGAYVPAFEMQAPQVPEQGRCRTGGAPAVTAETTKDHTNRHRSGRRGLCGPGADWFHSVSRAFRPSGKGAGRNGCQPLGRCAGCRSPAVRRAR